MVEDIEALLGTDVDAGQVEALEDDLTIIAADCLDTLDEPKKSLALKYLIAHFLMVAGEGGKGAIQSESEGDISRTYAVGMKAGSQATSYGQLAKKLAPCLGEIMGDQPYRFVKVGR